MAKPAANQFPPTPSKTSGMQEGDRTAVSGAPDGDNDAFRSLVERHSRYSFGIAQPLTGSAVDAEDVVQEAWLRAHRQLGQFEGRADVRTWLHRITVNCSIDWIRSRRHREDAHDPADLEAVRSARLAPTQASRSRIGWRRAGRFRPGSSGRWAR